MKHSLYFSKSDSESVTQKRLVSLTEEYQAAVAQSGPENLMDHEKYISAFNAIKAEGESRDLDIFEDWHE